MSTFGLTLTNPMTILSFAAIYAGLGLGSRDSDLADAGTMVLGVLLGSVLWQPALSGGVSLFRAKFTPVSLVWVDRISGVVNLVFGVASLLSVLWRAIEGRNLDQLRFGQPAGLLYRPNRLGGLI